MILSASDKHSIFSSIREEYVEYIFLAELCSQAWKSGRFVEVARSSTDAFGYDIILTCEGITRHVQLKATRKGESTSFQKINTNLSKAPSGCVVWLYVENETLRPIKYGWFGDSAGDPLPALGDEVAKHTKGNSDGEKLLRPNIRKVKKSNFEWFEEIGQVFDCLFGN